MTNSRSVGTRRMKRPILHSDQVSVRSQLDLRPAAHTCDCSPGRLEVFCRLCNQPTYGSAPPNLRGIGPRRLLRALALILFGLLLQSQVRGQSIAPDASQSPPEKQDDPAVTIFDHSKTSRFWISGQVNVVLQWHQSFPAKYSGPNSLHSFGENATSRVLTLFTALRLNSTTEVLADVESAGGHGISEAFGLAGFTNLDVVRNPSLGSAPYLARFMIHKVIRLSKESEEAEPGPLSIITQLPTRRIELRAGKFGLVDFFDQNSVGSDSHLQFLNWTIDNNGAYDYAADTRGYTYGVIVEYDQPGLKLRLAEAMMPKIANGINLDLNLARARGENLEFELDHSLIRGRAGAYRALAYVNHANMGSYREATDRFLAGLTPTPEIEATRRQGRIKYGFLGSFEQEVTSRLRLYGRTGWNEGHNESFAYTEVNDTLQLGADMKASTWHRNLDRIGIAAATNGISSDHRRYLALGGLGFLLGDGRLNYGRENIVEGYYTAHLWRGAFFTFDLQHVNNPGYNRDRGPVLVPSVRLHLDL
jgi:high affinity Mn2+ porin